MYVKLLKNSQTLKVTKPAQCDQLSDDQLSITLIRINLAGELYSKLRQKCGLKRANRTICSTRHAPSKTPYPIDKIVIITP